MLGMVASTYDVEAVLMAVATTAGVTLALTLFAFQTKIDFTGCGGEISFKLIEVANAFFRSSALCSGDLLYNWNILFFYSFRPVTYYLLKPL